MDVEIRTDFRALQQSAYPPGLMSAASSFEASKREILHKLQEVIDKSPKGSVDAPIVDMIERLNAHNNYVTCSSCSGRIAVFCGVAQSPDDDDSHLITKGGKWLVSSHAPVTYDEFTAQVLADPTSLQGMVIFKHEPFIMHVQCRDEDAAKILLQCGLACGFRESGVVLGNKRTMVAIRTTANAMEIPIAMHGKLMVDEAYLRWLLDIANEKFHANRAKTDKLFAAMLSTLFRPTATHLVRVQPNQSTVAVSRAGHTSVVFQNQLLVVGGQGPTATNTTRLADLVVIDTNNPTTVHSLPLAMPARMYHSAVMWRDTMLLFGGRASPAKAFGDLWSVTPQGAAVCIENALGEAPAPRWSHVSVLVGSKMFVYGGRDASHVFDDAFVLSLDATPPTWREVSSRDVPRFRHAAVAVDHLVHVFGGWSGLDATAQVPVANHAVFDTTTELWTSVETKGNAPTPRAGLAACVVAGQHIVMTGGSSSASPCHHDVHSLNLRTMTWKARARMPDDALLVNHTMTTVHDNRVFVVGGSCQCFGFGAIYSPVLTLSVETAEIASSSGSTSDTKPATTHDQLVLVVPKARVKTIKTLLESLHLYDKARRIQPITDEAIKGRGYFTVPVVDGIREQAHPELQEHAITQITGAARFVPNATTEREVQDTTEVFEEQALTVETKGDASRAAAMDAVEQSGTKELDVFAVVVEKDAVKSIKVLLESKQLYDKTRRIHPHGDSSLFAVPIVTSELPVDDPVLGSLDVVQDTLSDVKRIMNPTVVLQSLLQAFATVHNLAPVAPKFEFISDILVLPKNSFVEPEWHNNPVLWQSILDRSPVPLQRIARSADVDTNEKRQSHVELVYVSPTFVTPSRGVGWVEVRENGLVYGWDIQKVMFSSGNVTEKARMATIGCAGETIVDMYAGIGYYVIPFLVHGKAAYVHALEWNPDSVQALRFNLERNKVASRCTVYPGDNRISGPLLGAIADRVNLGLLPKSEHGWPVAVQVLKPTGGWLHVHENVAVQDFAEWQAHVVQSIQELGRSVGKHWHVECRHLEKVKSYAPKVFHVVADIHCTPADTASPTQ
ncbi:Aste57867_1060 [Aphanomyces stellatus]|uniref:tRNA wybutosine-synthesizing protein 3 n=1 Tax=Aphanomyces stellatus TaxID=120398 RepID=A0A485K9P8_9STRA|nr:hypothetical protein As57867_001059 [Aphanomyces stellatus]VFT78282.1 Aste57867_1060 [Aphanomyces stellatus]